MKSTINGERLDYEILRELSQHKQPQGAVYLSIALGDRYNVSQSTIGRKLLQFDHKGYTKKVKNTGRCLTKKGLEYLEELTDLLTGEKAKKDFFESLTPTNMKELVDILVTRRGLEKEAAYLAALNADERQINTMERILSEQKKKIEKYGTAGDEEDSQFHKLIAASSGNKVLLKAIVLVRKQNVLTEHFATVRKIIGGKVYEEHLKILNCIKNKDPNGAVKAMEEHINKIIKEFSNFSSLTDMEFESIIRDFNANS